MRERKLWNSSKGIQRFSSNRGEKMPQSSHLQTHMHSHTIGRRKSVGIEMQKHSVLNPFAIEHCLQKCTLFAKGVLRNNFLITVSRHKDLESIFT